MSKIFWLPVVGLILLLGAWTWVLTNGGATPGVLPGVAWPVACTTKGCVTTSSWQRQYEAQVAFARASETEEPKYEEALTTVLRQRLVEQTQLQTPVTEKDAVRYREEILNATDESAVLDTTGLTLAEYDQFVILPLLRQEALRSQRRVESLGELYQLLASERLVIVFPFNLKWDKETASVVQN